MTALGLLKIYCVALLIYYLFTMFNYNGRRNFKLIGIGVSVAYALISYFLGWGFLIAGKWILSQFGIVVASDIVYVVVYIIFNLIGAFRIRV